MGELQETDPTISGRCNKVVGILKWSLFDVLMYCKVMVVLINHASTASYELFIRQYERSMVKLTSHLFLKSL